MTATHGETLNFYYWSGALPSINIQQTGTDIKVFSYWVDGLPYAVPYPSFNGSFMIFMPL